jgi:hypothetical protein
MNQKYNMCMCAQTNVGQHTHTHTHTHTCTHKQHVQTYPLGVTANGGGPTIMSYANPEIRNHMTTCAQRVFKTSYPRCVRIAREKKHLQQHAKRIFEYVTDICLDRRLRHMLWRVWYSQLLYKPCRMLCVGYGTANRSMRNGQILYKKRPNTL